eukprot:GHVR01086201.1.p1 GENE.GHVR01086201.1~~GHVR01086201.1.p1  ORF type:complete len:227 (+),score=32.97 GHVR01086201.1:3-683(+)
MSRANLLVLLVYSQLQLITVSSAPEAPSVPYEFDWAGRVLALPDVHADYDVAFSVLESAGIVDSDAHWVARDTLLVQLGDQINVGPDTKKIIEWFSILRSEALEHNSLFLLILGNHEVVTLFGTCKAPVHPDDIASFGSIEKRLQSFEDGSSAEYVLSLHPSVKVNDDVFFHTVPLPHYVSEGLTKFNEDVISLLHDPPPKDGTYHHRYNVLLPSDSPSMLADFST